MSANQISIDTLLSPEISGRVNYCAHLYAPYSIKLHRRVYLYTHSLYDLWALLESDPDTVKFNERVPPIPISLENGRAILDSPHAFSVECDGQCVLHTINASILDGDEKSKTGAWKRWCEANGFQHREWTEESLRTNPIELANLKRLLRFTSASNYIPNKTLEQALIAELRNVRKTTFAKLIQQFPLSDPDEVQQSLICLIVNRKIYSDICTSIFSMITELSAYHEFN